MENLKYTFGQVNDWIKTADQKAMILGSFNIAGFIYQLVNLDKLVCGSIYTLILSIVSIAATLVTLYFWLRIIYPKLDNKHKKSKIYFQHIANAYENDIASGIDDLQKIDDEEYKKDLASQIVINSIIAKKKYASIQKFIWAFGVQLVTLLLLLISLI
ncbi:DUF5706 domain-containing protein [Candidatus Nomurabacteria bacterium]|nr:DUF5706 domain-containing protein [Candidatus Nomurabacteria bacterium]